MHIIPGLIIVLVSMTMTQQDILREKREKQELRDRVEQCEQNRATVCPLD